MITALGHFEAGRLAEAAGACEAILQRVPHDWLALRLLGGVREKEGDFDQAARFSPRRCRLPRREPRHIQSAERARGRAARKRDFEGALVCCRRALTRNPHDPGALHNCGHALVALNCHAEALEQFRQALMAPDSLDLRHNEGIAMLALGMWPQGMGTARGTPDDARICIRSISSQRMCRTGAARPTSRASRSCCRPNRVWAIRCISFATLPWWPRSARVLSCACSPLSARCWHDCRLRIRCSHSPTRSRMLTCSVRS